jgi:hypothetical protein
MSRQDYFNFFMLVTLVIAGYLILRDIGSESPKNSDDHDSSNTSDLIQNYTHGEEDGDDMYLVEKADDEPYDNEKYEDEFELIESN